MRRLLSVLALLVACSPASASTTLGSVSPSAANGCTAGYMYMNYQAASPSYVAPGPGVITSFTVSGGGNAGKKVELFVVRLLTGGADPWAVKAKSAIFTLAGNATETFSGLHLKAAKDDSIALGAVDALSNCYGPATSADNAVAAYGTASSEGGTATPTQGLYEMRVNISATLEPDADGDGFGDETQDGCPVNAATSGPCTVDLALTASATPASVPVGGTAVVAFTVQAAQAGTGVVVRPMLPAGLTVVASYPACTDACPLGALPAGATRSAIFVVTAASAGAFAVTGAAASDEPDANAGDNQAGATVTFMAAPKSTRTCKVPSLKALPVGFARRLLAAAGCKLGKTTRKRAKKGKRGTVIKQSRKPKAVLPAGSKVNVTLKK
jgi:hypothetical protein